MQIRRILVFFFPFLTLFVLPSLLFSQTTFPTDRERCGTVHYEKTRGITETQAKRFEQWLQLRSGILRNNNTGRKQSGPYKIPVVVHIIHNGEEVGTGPNLSEAQILSQIQVLNEDFKRLNPDAGQTPSEFSGVAAGLDIEFVMAKRNPEGLATNGIVRVNGNRGSWTMNDNYELKALSYWPSEDYLNIWVCNITDFIGYAQFPVSDILPGLENSSNNPLTDGVVIWHRAFGSADHGVFNLDIQYNKGRTATHEIGHFFGLKHIWGDESGCSGTDYVNDTPNQGTSTNNCPTHPKPDNCSTVIMFQNFMDYTNDACMNLFTQGQVDRMVTILENSPRRKSLPSSPGLLPPAPVANDMGIRQILFPDATVCSTTVTPTIEIRNYGSNTVTQVRIRFSADGITRETLDLNVSLAPLETDVVDFSPVTLSSGYHDLSFEILLTNGTTDGRPQDNILTGSTTIPSFRQPPVFVDFVSAPPGWILQNPDEQITWQIVTAPLHAADNKALKMDFFNYEDHVGEIDVYMSPVIDLSASTAATLTFDVAHARFSGSNDRLKVIILKNCETITSGTVKYDKAGASLSTAPASSNPFTPMGASHWRTEQISLAEFVGEPRIQVAFVGINDWGNNLYLDNISLSTVTVHDLALVGLPSPGIVTCSPKVNPVIQVQNNGTEPVTSFTVEYSMNGGALQQTTLTGLIIGVLEVAEVALPELTFSQTNNSLLIRLKDPNSQTDDRPENDSQTFPVVIAQQTERIPLRETIDDPSSLSRWTIINPANGMNWEPVKTNFNQSLLFNSWANENAADESWLVSPVLDLSGTNEASLVFDLSYRQNGEKKDIVSIRLSTNCGTTYFDSGYTIPGTSSESEAWKPATESDWLTNLIVNLDTLAGKSEARVAFRIQNQNGNNVYLDNIEFYTAYPPVTLKPESVYTLYGYTPEDPQRQELKITFNLEERQDVHYQVIALTGKQMFTGRLTEVLNQTFPLGVEKLLPGMYIVRLQIGHTFYSSKVLVPE